MTIHLREVRRTVPLDSQAGAYPFTVPAIRALDTLHFETPVTFLVGENGSGKSTLLEALAAATRLPVAGAQEMGVDDSLAAARRLAGCLKLSWSKQTRRGLFLRAEDFFGYARRLSAIRAGLEADLRAVDEEYADRSDYARSLAKLPFASELHALKEQYQGDLDHRSHGESFFSFFQARFVPDGLYLLDEPEAPLSPLRQMAFLSLMKPLVEGQRAQFIIATHSPILMAYPGATILNFDTQPIAPVAYNDLEHVRLTRDFLRDPESFLRHL